jgi:thioredoxin reductase
MKLLRINVIRAATCGGLLDGLDIRLRAPTEPYDVFDPLCFVGPNGSGKSQLMQVIAEICQTLCHACVPSEERLESNRSLEFEIEYLIRPSGAEHPVHVRASRIRSGKRKPHVMIERMSDGGWSAVDITSSEAMSLLPTKIVGYTSGDNETLTSYGVTFVDAEVTAIRCLTRAESRLTAFAVETATGEHHARSILLATGMIDQLPENAGVKDAYGEIVHHCPYCDGWEHRDQALVALGDAAAAPKLGAELLAWSERVTVCTNGEALSEVDRFKLERLGIAYCCEAVARLDGEGRKLHFANGHSTSCEALFFSSEQSERSKLPQMLGCQCDDEGFVVTKDKQCTSIAGVYLAGDADGDVQFAIVAAAEGAIAATAIHEALLEQHQAG